MIVGHIDGATFPSPHLVVTCNIPKAAATMVYPFIGGRSYPGVMTNPARRELGEVTHVLEAEGLTVRRPEP